MKISAVIKQPAAASQGRDTPGELANIKCAPIIPVTIEEPGFNSCEFTYEVAYTSNKSYWIGDVVDWAKWIYVGDLEQNCSCRPSGASQEQIRYQHPRRERSAHHCLPHI